MRHVKELILPTMLTISAMVDTLTDHPMYAGTDERAEQLREIVRELRQAHTAIHECGNMLREVGL